jgi:hypothetical protein
MSGTYNHLLHLTAEAVPLYQIYRFLKVYFLLDGIQIASASIEQSVIELKE